METPAAIFKKIQPFWDDEYKKLEYINEPFNNSLDVSRWQILGYRHGKFTGDMCDMRRTQPSWNGEITRLFEDMGWRDVCTSYYRMPTGTILPVHVDTYKRYIEIFNLKNKESTIRRALIFLEDWSSGHYLEINSVPITNWLKGDCYIWKKDTPHMAANIGLQLRYTLQITGHVCE